MPAPSGRSGVRWAILGLATVLSLSCTGTSGETADPATTPADGWIAEIVLDPPAFAALMDETGRDGWIALHANDLDGAAAAFPGGGPAADRARARAELGLAVLHDDLARLSRVAHDRLFQAWDRRGGVPEDSVAPAIAALSARCAGQPWKPWADRAAKGPGAAFSASLGNEEALWPTAAPEAPELASDPLVKRRMVHAAARLGDPAPLLAVATAPLVVEQADGFERTFWDPCLHDTLTRAWMGRTTTSLGHPGKGWREALSALSAEDAGPSTRLFAPWLTGADLTSELKTARVPGTLGATMPTLEALGITRDPVPADEIDRARDEARQLMDATDAWRLDLDQRANDDGRALLADLRLCERFRHEWLVARARHALLDDRPKQALAYLQLARDVATPEVGPSNSPAALALLAEAELRNGHTRESLDALQILVQAHPEVLGLKELIGDLAVLEGLDRRGDSKEN